MIKVKKLYTNHPSITSLYESILFLAFCPFILAKVTKKKITIRLYTNNKNIKEFFRINKYILLELYSKQFLFLN